MGIVKAMKDAIQNDSSKKTIFALGFVVIVIAVLVVVTYFFYNRDSNNYDDNIDFAIPEVVQEPQNDTQISQEAETTYPAAPEVVQEPQSDTQISQEVETTYSTAPEANQVDNANVTNDKMVTSEPSLKAIAQNVENAPAISQLKYAIKPLDKNIASCNTMRNGRWNVPDSCRDDVLSAIKKLVSANNDIIAIEVSGIVDNSPYSGPSAELKQEGLASFRAREVIGIITREFSNVAVFEGLSIQAPNKRGFEVKAYYLQN